MNSIIVLDVNFNFGYGEDSIHPVIFQDENEMILVDCGYTGFLPLLEQSAADKGVDFSKLTKVIITHHDHDHMGSLAAIKKKYSNVKVITSEADSPYVSGRLKSLRLEQAEQRQLMLAPEQREEGIVFQNILKSVECTEVDVTVKDGDCIPCCGGIEIVATPGHMSGHISLYLKEHKTLISGDALAIVKGNLEIPEPKYTLNMAEAIKSLLKLMNYDIQRIICYHGGEFIGDIQNALSNADKMY